jgi:hypothetical protein
VNSDPHARVPRSDCPAKTHRRQGAAIRKNRGRSPKEYKRLKRTQPSYRDRLQLLSLNRDEWSEWMLFDDDIAARVRRIGDGKEFVLGLAELKVVDKQSPNHHLLDDYSVWYVNSRF